MAIFRTINMSDLTKEGVIKKLKTGRFVSCKPNKKYDPHLRSEVYNVINVIYDTKSKLRVKTFYQCNNCNKILMAKTSSGNRSLRNHACFVIWKKENNPDEV